MQNDLPGKGVEDEALYHFREHRLSWVAYLSAALKGLVAMAIGGALMVLPRWMAVAPMTGQGLFYAGLAFIICALVMLIYRVLWIRRVRLYSDQDGV